MMNHQKVSLRASALACATLACTAGAQISTFEFMLSGDQEVPGIMTDASGSATLAYDASTQTFDLSLTTMGIALSDLLGVGPNNSPIHIHSAPPGSNGPIVVDLGIFANFVDQGGGVLTFEVTGLALGGPQGAIPATDINQNEADLFAGALYINIHTSTFPGGELRGQIVPTPATGAVAVLAGLVAARRRRS